MALLNEADLHKAIRVVGRNIGSLSRVTATITDVAAKKLTIRKP